MSSENGSSRRLSGSFRERIGPGQVETSCWRKLIPLARQRPKDGGCPRSGRTSELRKTSNLWRSSSAVMTVHPHSRAEMGFALFSVSGLKDEKLIKSKPTWKLKHANSILESCEHLSQISSKSILISLISSYTASKLVRFLEHNVKDRVRRSRWTAA